MDQDEKYLEEFKEAATFHRLQNTLLLGQTTIFLAANAGLLSIITNDPPLNNAIQFGLQITGILFAILMWVIADRAYQYSDAARVRAGVVGEKLGFTIYKKWVVPKSRIMPAAVAMKLFYILGGIGWVLFLIFNCIS